jgi:hypothetical protein
VSTASGLVAAGLEIPAEYSIASFDERPDLDPAIDELFRAADDKHWMVRELMVAAASAVTVGKLTVAAQLCGTYDVLREPLGEMATPFKTLNLPDPMVQAREGLGEDAFANAYAAGRAMTLDEVASLLG